MKQKIYRRHFLVPVILIFMSCAIFIPGYSDYASAKRYYSNRQYDAAVFSVSNSLRIKPKNPKGINLLESAYPLAIHGHKSKIEKLETVTDKSKWPKLVVEYEALQKLGTMIKFLKPILQNGEDYILKLNVEDYSYELKEAQLLAAAQQRRFRDDILCLCGCEVVDLQRGRMPRARRLAEGGAGDGLRTHGRERRRDAPVQHLPRVGVVFVV